VNVVGSTRFALVAFTLGVALMLVFDAAITRIGGVALLLGGVALGVFAIASDEFIADDEPDGS